MPYMLQWCNITIMNEVILQHGFIMVLFFYSTLPHMEKWNYEELIRFPTRCFVLFWLFFLFSVSTVTSVITHKCAVWYYSSVFPLVCTWCLRALRTLLLLSYTLSGLIINWNVTVHIRSFAYFSTTAGFVFLFKPYLKL